MKKLSAKTAASLLLACGLAATVFPAASAVPSAEASMVISDVAMADDGLIVTVDIAVSAPSEPYASLDFNLITSDLGKLSVVDLDDDPDVAELDIDFTPDYGSAYHQGQDDAESGGYRYLIGIYSRAGGNLIGDAVPVCSVRLRYSGDEPQTLRIRDMKLVYVDDGGDVLFTPVASEPAALTVDGSLFAAGIPEMPLPLSEARLPARSWHNAAIMFAIGVAACCAAVILIRTKRKGGPG
jgi:hypothetical protein